jgi:SET domain-containing protein
MHGAKSEKDDTVKVQVRVGPSRIAGKGLFATQEIKKGTRIIQYIGEKIPKSASEERLDDDNAYIMYLNTRYDIDGKTRQNRARYINHSCDPNCALDNTGRAIWIVAIRDIPAGEELSYDYGFAPAECAEYPCNCGAKNCCGYILAREYWGLLERQGH